jgi:hypothetical protein
VLDLPAGLTPQAMLAIGYRARDPRRRPRLPLAEMIVLYD